MYNNNFINKKDFVESQNININDANKVSTKTIMTATAKMKRAVAVSRIKNIGKNKENNLQFFLYNSNKKQYYSIYSYFQNSILKNILNKKIDKIINYYRNNNINNADIVIKVHGGGKQTQILTITTSLLKLLYNYLQSAQLKSQIKKDTIMYNSKYKKRQSMTAGRPGRRRNKPKNKR